MRVYGTCRLKDGVWEIDAEPHVLLRLKRMFKRARAERGTVQLQDTKEICRDLEWFITRFPLEVNRKQYLHRRAAAFEETIQTAQDLLAGREKPRAFEMALPAREYQRVAADLALRMGGLLVADDVGLGKTATAICALTDPSTRPALVVTLTHLPKQWEAELRKFAPELTTHILQKGTPYPIVETGPQRELVKQGFPDVIITNYHKLSGWQFDLAPVIKGIVFDEIQELRRDDSQKHRAATFLAEKCRLRLGLSATPIYNYGQEFWNITEAVRPGALGTRAEFLTEWCGGRDDRGKARIMEPRAFGTYVRESALMVRRTRSDVGRELPPLSKAVHHVDADEKELDKVRDSATELAKIILAQGGKGFDKLKASEELAWKLRQATGIAKAPYVAEFVKLLVEAGEQVVLYGWHRAVYDLWESRLRGCSPVFYTGAETPKKKGASRDAFLRGDARVLVMSLRAGAGLDGLQGASNVVVFGELDWSPGVHEQAVGRVYRDGQGRPVTAYFLVADAGSDPVVSDALGLKKSQIEGIRDPDAELIETLDGGANVRALAEAHLRAMGLDPTAHAA